MRKKRFLAIIILAIGVAMIVTGVFLLVQADESHASYNGIVRASTSIEFGADFYTVAAQYTGLAANTMIDLYKIVAISFGCFFVFAGGIDICVTLMITNLFYKENVMAEKSLCEEEK